MADAFTEKLAILGFNFNRIVPILQIIFGTFGNIMNIIIFTRRSLRSNPCSIYFLALSFNNIFVLYVALLTRLLSSGWNIDPSQTSNTLCKLRIFFVYIALCLTQWFIVLASIDRFLSSCHTARYRQLSNKSVAQKATIFLVLVTALAHFHMLVWWTSDYDGEETICNIFNDAYELAFEIFYIIVTCVLPPILMLIFGLKTILNVRKLRTQVTPLNDNARNERLRSKDRQMITMLLFQVVITVICTTPFTAINLYATIEDNIGASPLSPDANAVYNFSANIVRLVNYLSPVLGFYIYTLTSRTFRIEIKRIFGGFLVKTGLFRYLPENLQRKLFEQNQTLTNNQSMSLTKKPTRVVFVAAKNTTNQLTKHNGNIPEISII